MGQYDLNPVDGIASKVVHVRSSYTKRGWTWSAVHNNWIQVKYPNARAYLIHINSGYLLPTF